MAKKHTKKKTAKKSQTAGYADAIRNSKKRPSAPNILRIDPDRLDEELYRQADLFHEAWEDLAYAKEALAKGDADLKHLKASVADEMRADPDAYGLEKTTKDAIADAVAGDEAVLEQEQKNIDLRLRVDLCQGLVNALEHKKRAMTDAVELRRQSYFADPSATFDRRREQEDANKRRARRKRPKGA